MKKSELLKQFQREEQLNVERKKVREARRAELNAPLNNRATCLVEFNGVAFELFLEVRKLAPLKANTDRPLLEKVCQAFANPHLPPQVDPVVYQQHLKNHLGLALQSLAIGLLIGETENEQAQTEYLVSQLAKRGVNVALI
ncbi:hypothetical protein Q7434_04315 [Glaesserella parasuis]|nr:hypothetical protein [Glaesserella parasuis]MDP0038932.1 hypothetical protein [Glaesserella parasuis]MDP0081351.1 hypothetical protein [Glaesserella parasuis]